MLSVAATERDPAPPQGMQKTDVPAAFPRISSALYKAPDNRVGNPASMRITVSWDVYIPLLGDLKVNNSAADGNRDRLGAVFCAEFIHDVLDMNFDRLLGDV